VKPSVKDRKKFDLDLQYGQVREDMVAEILKDLIESLDYIKTVRGGDNMASKMYLISLQKLFSGDAIKTFGNKNDKQKT
jgi:hypothetical protein